MLIALKIEHWWKKGDDQLISIDFHFLKTEQATLQVKPLQHRGARHVLTPGIILTCAGGGGCWWFRK